MERDSHIKSVAHITIGVTDLKKSVSLFQDVLGLDKIGEWPSYAIFNIEGVTLGLEPKTKTEICFLVDDVDKTYRNLKDKGVEFVTEPKDQPRGVRDATIIDPDGNTFIIESFHCKVCGKICQNYSELLEEHLHTTIPSRKRSIEATFSTYKLNPIKIEREASIRFL